MNRPHRFQRPLSGEIRSAHRFSRPTNPALDRPRVERANATSERYPEAACQRKEVFETFVQSVSCLLSNDDPTPIERQALVSLVRQSFPEYTRAKSSLGEAQERQQRQVKRLGPQLLSNASMIGDPEDGGSEDQAEVIDDSARIMYELSRIDEQIEALQKRINLLQHQILTWVQWDRPSNARVVRWALERA